MWIEAVDKIKPVENMPFFYKFKIFRFKTQMISNESLGRKEGYKLNCDRQNISWTAPKDLSLIIFAIIYIMYAP